MTCAVWSTWGHATGSCERGLLHVPWGKHPRRQILTIEDVLTGKIATPTRLDFNKDDVDQ